MNIYLSTMKVTVFSTLLFGVVHLTSPVQSRPIMQASQTPSGKNKNKENDFELDAMSPPKRQLNLIGQLGNTIPESGVIVHSESSQKYGLENGEIKENYENSGTKQPAGNYGRSSKVQGNIDKRSAYSHVPENKVSLSTFKENGQTMRTLQQGNKFLHGPASKSLLIRTHRDYGSRQVKNQKVNTFSPMALRNKQNKAINHVYRQIPKIKAGYSMPIYYAVEYQHSDANKKQTVPHKKHVPCDDSPDVMNSGAMFDIGSDFDIPGGVGGVVPNLASTELGEINTYPLFIKSNTHNDNLKMFFDLGSHPDEDKSEDVETDVGLTDGRKSFYGVSVTPTKKSLNMKFPAALVPKSACWKDLFQKRKTPKALTIGEIFQLLHRAKEEEITEMKLKNVAEAQLRASASCLRELLDDIDLLKTELRETDTAAANTVQDLTNLVSDVFMEGGNGRESDESFTRQIAGNQLPAPRNGKHDDFIDLKHNKIKSDRCYPSRLKSHIKDIMTSRKDFTDRKHIDKLSKAISSTHRLIRKYRRQIKRLDSRNADLEHQLLTSEKALQNKRTALRNIAV